MENEIDLSNAVSMLGDMLESEEGKAQIESIISALGGAHNEKPPASAQGFGADNMDMMLKIQKVMALMNNNKNSKQAAFLQSLCPLLRPERRETVENAVKFLSMGRAIKLFKEFDGV